MPETVVTTTTTLQSFANAVEGGTDFFRRNETEMMDDIKDKRSPFRGWSTPYT